MTEGRGRYGPSVGEPGYLPYCACPGLRRAERGESSFICKWCGLDSRIVNGVDMFDQTAPLPATPPPDHHNTQSKGRDDG